LGGRYPVFVPLLATTLVQVACGSRGSLDDNPGPSATYGASPPIGRDASGGASPGSSDAATPDAHSFSRGGGSGRDATTDSPSAAASSSPPSIEDGGLLDQCLTGGNRLFVYGDPGEITHVGSLAFGPTSGSWGSLGDPSFVKVVLGPHDTS